ncbi:hypothetical protein [Desertimonas flava]|uniref:hypothetical protein n=1 Tax=Desertimonas flava TaxID=2064846 RepID=UPI0013C447EB|nr:hypothetical protein [Desertimonas flava]
MTDTTMARLVPPRFGTPRDPTRPTLGTAETQIADAMGLELHPWQQYVADVSGEFVERDPSARHPGASRLRLAAQIVGVLVGRQTGKTTRAAVRIATQAMLPDLPDVAALVGLERIVPQYIGFTAQDRAAALKRFFEHVDMIMSSDLRSEVDRVVRQRGDESVRFRNGSAYSVFTPSDTGPRGSKFDLVIIDEALAHTVALLGSTRPTQAQRDGAIGCIGAQLVIVSNAGDDSSTLLNAERELGRRAVAEGDRSRAWFEWSAADDADIYDPDVWATTIPTLDQPNGLSTAYLQIEAESMTAHQFRQEYLCMHTNRPELQLLDVDAWAAAPVIDIAYPGELMYAIDADPNGDHAVIAAAGEAAGRPDLVAVEVFFNEPGVAWIVDTIATYANRDSAPVVVDALGPLAWTIAALERAGVTVIEARTADIHTAAGELAAAITDGRIAHQDDEQLAEAITAARPRFSRDRWGIDRHADGGDHAALIAVSLAHWAVHNHGVPTVYGGPLL